MPLESAVNTYIANTELPAADLTSEFANIYNNFPKYNGAEAISGAWTFSSAIGFAAGSVSAPGFAFSSDTDTGIYRSAADSVGIAGGGASLATVDAAGLDVVAAGTAAAPAVTVGGDTDSGLYQVAADEIGIAGGGAYLAKFAAAVVDLTPAGSESAPGLVLNGDTDSGLYHAGADDLRVSIGGSRALTIDGTGLDAVGKVVASGDVEATGGYRSHIVFVASQLDSTATDRAMHLAYTYNDVNALHYSLGEWVAPRAGSITAASLRSEREGGINAFNSNGDRTAGTMTLNIQKNGTTVWSPCVLDAGTVNNDSATQAKDTDTFAAGDRIRCTLTTSSFAPAESAVVVVEIET